jgi:colicin import membrane protein
VFSELRQKPKALALSALFHAVIIGIIVINFNFTDKTILVKHSELTKTVKAKVIDQQALEQQKNKKKAIEEKRRKEIEKKKREKEAKKRKAAEEKKRKDVAKKKNKEEAKRKATADKKKKKEASRIATAKKKAEQEKQQKIEKQKKLELDKQKKLEAEKQKKLAEEKRLREQRLAKEAEEKRLLEEKKKQEAERVRLADEEQKRRQQELNAKMQAEETHRRLNSLRDQYILAIRNRIEDNWTLPPGTEKIDCEFKVSQTSTGYIASVSFGDCTGGSPDYRNSIERAVYKSEPLPKPGDPSLFERDLIFQFKPE